MRMIQKGRKTSLANARIKIQNYRENRKKAGKLPDWIWDLAVNISEYHPPAAVAKDFNLDYNKLKQKAAESKKKNSLKIDTGFLEIKLKPEEPTNTHVVEVINARGSILRLYPHSKVIALLPELLRSF